MICQMVMFLGCHYLVKHDQLSKARDRGLATLEECLAWKRPAEQLTQ